MEHRPVRGATSAETVSLHHALESAPLRRADHVDAIDPLEDVDENGVARFEFVAGIERELAEHVIAQMLEKNEIGPNVNRFFSRFWRGVVNQASAANPPIAMRYMKEGLRRARHARMDEMGAYVGSSLAYLFTTEDHREGALAFVERREPRWQGR